MNETKDSEYPNMVSFDSEKLARLKDAYNKAVAAKQDVFKFEGNDYVVNYAKYLIGYIEDVLDGYDSKTGTYSP